MAHWKKYTLQFKRPGGTSRGVLHTKDSWFIMHPGRQGLAIGECSVIEGLSPDDMSQFEAKLDEVCRWLNGEQQCGPNLSDFPAIAYGVEMLHDDLDADQNRVFFDDSFTRGEKGMLINGLVWMGEPLFMLEQVKQKVDEGFSCVKLKVGALEFETEVNLLKQVRSEYGHELELRLDANGGFGTSDALEKLNRLSDFGIHSIEQPIKPNQWDEMAMLAERSPIPIALDEELISNNEVMEAMLGHIKPQYIILKPSLIGGMKPTKNWIECAKDLGIGWWVTSALESNIGLNHITQCTHQLDVEMPQGFGTGSLFTNNFNSPLYIQGEMIKFDPSKSWDLKNMTDE